MNQPAAILNVAATDQLPFFVAAPGQTDGLFDAMIVFLIVVVFAVGLLYLRLQALPEHLAHGTSKVQLQLVGAGHGVALILVILSVEEGFPAPLQTVGCWLSWAWSIMMVSAAVPELRPGSFRRPAGGPICTTSRHRSW